RLYRIRTRVNGDDIVFFRIIVVKQPFSVDGWKLNLSHQVDRGDNRLFLWIDYGRVVAVAIERKDVLGDRFIYDCVRCELTRRDLASYLERLQIEKHDLLDSPTRSRVAV